MDKINWASYNYEEFVLFCNAFFTFEFGKQYQPFSAPGRDGGIDGTFNGKYQNEIGKWRFQFKFTQSPRSEGVTRLRYQIRQEAEKLDNEDFFALVTNLELLPQECSSIETIFYESISASGKSAKIRIWDGARLATALVSYPLLRLWMGEGFKTAQLRRYKDVYEKNLNKDDFSPVTLANFFSGRSEHLTSLKEFLKSEQSLAIVSGEAGIGKTRLILEFFKSYVDFLPNWTPLVLVNRAVEFDKISKSLAGGQYVILIDDAHTYDPKVIADIKAIADLSGRIKLILTTRKLESNHAIAFLKEYERQEILQIDLGELSRKLTEEAFKVYVGDTDYKHYLNELVTLSFGKPIMIVATLNAISNQVPINQIRTESFLTTYVLNYFDSYIEKLTIETGLEKIYSRRLLQAVSLLEPFNFSNSDITNQLSSLLGLNIVVVKRAMEMLIEYSFVSGRYSQSIKPDYYSDIILSEINSDEVLEYLVKFPSLADNIIINLSCVDEISKVDESFLHRILLDYINLIYPTREIYLIEKILNTVWTISQLQQVFARKTIEIYLHCLSLPDHPISREYSKKNNLRNNFSNTTNSIIISILKILNDYEANWDFVFRKSLVLYQRTNDEKITSVFSFNKRDVLNRFDMERQLFFLRKIGNFLDDRTIDEIIFYFQCLKNIAQLEFSLSDWSEVSSVSITTYFLPASKNVKKARKILIEQLINLYGLSNNVDLKYKVLDEILDLPRGILSTSRNPKPYYNNVEIKQTLEFIKSNVEKFSLLERKRILDRLFWFVVWGVSEELKPLIEKIKQSFEPKNLVEHLSQSFSNAEMSMTEIPDIQSYIKTMCEEMVQSTDEITLAKSIAKFLALEPYPPHYYWNFQRQLEKSYPSYSKALFIELFTNYREQFPMFASSILSSLYFVHADTEFFWKQIKILLKLNTPETDNVLLEVYAQRVPGETFITTADCNTIIKVFRRRGSQNDRALGGAIQLLFSAKHPDALSICKLFLVNIGQRESEFFFTRLRDNDQVTFDQMLDLVLNHTIKIDLSYEIEKCLSDVLTHRGPDVVFQYLLKRFKFKQDSMIKKELLYDFEFVPNHNNSHLFRDNDTLKLTMFLSAVDWYLSVEVDGILLYHAKSLFKYLRPYSQIDEHLFNWYQTKIKSLATNVTALERLLETVSGFHQKNSLLIQIIMEVYRIVSEHFESAPEELNKIYFVCFDAIMNVGGKSGTIGVPFQVDLDLKELLDKEIVLLPDYQPEKVLLRSILKSVEADISRSQDRGNLTW